jgi:integrase
MDELTFRQFEFCNWYKERLFTYLIRDELYLEAAFCMIGIDLMLRQNEISMLTWEQIDLDNRIIKDVKQSRKWYPDQKELFSYGDLHMTENIYIALIQYKMNCKCDTGKLFPIVNRGIFYDKIQKSIGDITFNGIRLRQIGRTLKVAEIGGEHERQSNKNI